MQKNRILVTGAVGFIGANLCLKLFEKSENVHIIGIDNMNAYYDVNIKKWRLSEIERVASGQVGMDLRGISLKVISQTKHVLMNCFTHISRILWLI